MGRLWQKTYRQKIYRVGLLGLLVALGGSVSLGFAQDDRNLYDRAALNQDMKQLMNVLYSMNLSKADRGVSTQEFYDILEQKNQMEEIGLQREKKSMARRPASSKAAPPKVLPKAY